MWARDWAKAAAVVAKVVAVKRGALAVDHTHTRTLKTGTLALHRRRMAPMSRLNNTKMQTKGLVCGEQ